MKKREHEEVEEPHEQRRLEMGIRPRKLGANPLSSRTSRHFTSRQLSRILALASLLGESR
jgi:hypothetical protein